MIFSYDSYLCKKTTRYDVMSHLSVEEKLQLMSQIRSEHELNQIQMNRREQIVYGKKSKGNFPLQAAEDKTEDETKDSVFSFSFKIRWILALILFFMLIWMKFWNITLGTISYDRILSSLQNNAIDFDKYISYTDGVDNFKEKYRIGESFE